MFLKKHFCSLVFLAIFWHTASFAQIPNINLNTLSVKQFTTWLDKYGLSDLTESELVEKARQMGLSSSQIEALKERLSDQNLSEGMKKQSKPGLGKRTSLIPKNNLFTKDSVAAFPIFGADIFQNQSLSFEPDLSISTPQNYLVGINDQLIIDLFGVSDLQQKLTVSPEGTIRFPNFGPISVAGLSIENVRLKLKQSLLKIYPGLINGSVGIQVSLGQIRTIRVTLIGEILRPGNYNIPSLSTLMNALYESGGPSPLGSFRKIDLVRNGKLITRFDLYDFLLKGDLTQNLLLQDGDVIRVAAYQNRVALKGAIRKQALYDVKEGETAADIINYAGGLAETAIKNSFTIIRNGPTRKEILTLSPDQLKNTKLVSGDTLLIDSIRASFRNKLVITGAVEHPGAFGTDQVKDLKSLLVLATISPNAFQQRAVLKRYTNAQPTIMGFDVEQVLNGKFNLSLEPDDSVHIYKQQELQGKYTVNIQGEVNKAGNHNFFKGLRLYDLLVMAGGLKDGASTLQMEVSRRIRVSSQEADSIRYTLIKKVSLDTANLNQEAEWELEPFDMVFIRRSPGYRDQQNMIIEGEVAFPGKYSFSPGADKISDIIKRAGGLTELAFPEGASLLRKTKIDLSLADTSWLKKELARVQEKKERASVQQNEAVSQSASADTSSINIQKWLTDSTNRSWSPSRHKPIGIDLEKILRSPGSLDDIILEEGDILVIPTQMTTIQVMGAVQIPKQILFEPGMRVNKAILEAGGLQSNGDKKRSYVEYANGEVKATKRSFLFRNYPALKPGATLHIPLKTPRKGMSTGEAIGVISGLSSIISLLIFVLK